MYRLQVLQNTLLQRRPVALHELEFEEKVAVSQQIMLLSAYALVEGLDQQNYLQLELAEPCHGHRVWYLPQPQGRVQAVAAAPLEMHVSGNTGEIYNILADATQTDIRKQATVGKKPLGTRINAAGLALIKEFEGLQLEAYLCPAGVPTIGYGTTNGVHLGDQITEATATALLKEDLQRFEAAVSQAVQVPLTSNQFSALVCFAYNVGAEAFRTSTLLNVLNQGDYAAAAEELLRWNKAAGEVLPGLVRRRTAEQQLFLSDI